MGVWTVLKKEFKSYLNTPLSYALWTVWAVLGGYFFTVILLASQRSELGGYFGNMSVVLIFVAPLLTMRLLADEEQRGTGELLHTVPVTISQVVLGKYLASVAVYLLALLISFIYPLVLWRFGQPDWGVVAVSFLGFFLLGAAYLAVGVFASSLTSSQMVAGVTSMGILLLFWILGWLSTGVPGPVGELAKQLSLMEHLTDFLKGMLTSSNLVYYLSIIGAFLFLTVRVVERRAWA